MPTLNEYIANGTIKGGQLRIRNKRMFDLAMASMPEDAEVLVTVERVRATRSLAQNRWYWGVIVKAISDTTGYDPLEIHELLKEKFLPKTLALRTRTASRTSS
jgi:nitrogen fixation protein